MNRIYAKKVEMNIATLKSKFYRSSQKEMELRAQHAQASDELESRRSSDKLKFEQELEKLERIFSNMKKHALDSFDKKHRSLKSARERDPYEEKEWLVSTQDIFVEKNILFENIPFPYPNMLRGAEMHLTVYFDQAAQNELILTAKLRAPFGLCHLIFRNKEIKNLSLPPVRDQINNYKNPSNWRIDIKDKLGKYEFNITYVH
jgi:hypothetical protein